MRGIPTLQVLCLRAVGGKTCQAERTFGVASSPADGETKTEKDGDDHHNDPQQRPADQGGKQNQKSNDDDPEEKTLEELKKETRKTSRRNRNKKKAKKNENEEENENEAGDNEDDDDDGKKKKLSSASRLLRSFHKRPATDFHYSHDQDNETSEITASSSSSSSSEKDSWSRLVIPRTPSSGKGAARRNQANDVDLNHPWISVHWDPDEIDNDLDDKSNDGQGHDKDNEDADVQNVQNPASFSHSNSSNTITNQQHHESLYMEYGSPALDLLQAYIDSLVELGRLDDTRLGIHFFSEWKANVQLAANTARNRPRTTNKHSTSKKRKERSKRTIYAEQPRQWNVSNNDLQPSKKETDIHGVDSGQVLSPPTKRGRRKSPKATEEGPAPATTLPVATTAAIATVSSAASAAAAAAAVTPFVPTPPPPRKGRRGRKPKALLLQEAAAAAAQREAAESAAAIAAVEAVEKAEAVVKQQGQGQGQPAPEVAPTPPPKRRRGRPPKKKRNLPTTPTATAAASVATPTAVVAAPSSTSQATTMVEEVPPPTTTSSAPTPIIQKILQRRRRQQQQQHRGLLDHMPKIPIPLGSLSLYNSTIMNQTIHAMVESQMTVHLAVLDLTGVATLTDDLLQDVLQETPYLQRLSIKNCRRLTSRRVCLEMLQLPSSSSPLSTKIKRKDDKTKKNNNETTTTTTTTPPSKQEQQTKPKKVLSSVSLPYLTSLDIGGAYNLLPQDVLVMISKLPSLQELHASGLNWDDKSILQLIQSRLGYDDTDEDDNEKEKSNNDDDNTNNNNNNNNSTNRKRDRRSGTTATSSSSKNNDDDDGNKFIHLGWKGLSFGFSPKITTQGLQHALPLVGHCLESLAIPFCEMAVTPALMGYLGRHMIALRQLDVRGNPLLSSLTGWYDGRATNYHHRQQYHVDDRNNNDTQQQQQQQEELIRQQSLFVLGRYSGITKNNLEETKRIHPYDATHLTCCIDSTGIGMGIQRKQAMK